MSLVAEQRSSPVLPLVARRGGPNAWGGGSDLAILLILPHIFEGPGVEGPASSFLAGL